MQNKLSEQQRLLSGGEALFLGREVLLLSSDGGREAKWAGGVDGAKE